MAEAGSNKTFSKVLQRTVFRTKEKVLQNLGKADRTLDDAFDQHVLFFNDQQAASLRLQKELKHYMACVKEMSLASQSMYRTIKEVYEPEWTGFTEVTSAVEQLTTLWDEYLMKLTDQLHSPLVNYVSQFPEVKAKIAKRNRKLTDYDSARHAYDSSVTAKKQDDMKITKATDEMNEAKRIYEVINIELNEELPTLFRSRMAFIASHVHMLCSIESVFQHESAKLKDVMANVSSNLCQESSNTQRKFPSTSGIVATPTDPGPSRSPLSSSSGLGASTAPVVRLNTPPTTPAAFSADGLTQLAELESSIFADKNVTVKASVRTSTGSSDERRHASSSSSAGGGQQSPAMYNGKGTDEDRAMANRNVLEVDVRHADESSVDREGGGGKIKWVANSPPVHVIPSNGGDHIQVEKYIHEEKSPEGLAASSSVTSPLSIALASQDGVPEHRVLFRVEATHRYVGEDLDELTFDVGEIITVVPFDDPEEQDDGWLMGVKETTKEKGVFPENFTKRLGSPEQ